MAASLFWVSAVSVALNSLVATGAELPVGFVYLSEVAPTIRQDIRYAGSHNFIGRPVDGYQANECVLTEKAADALKRLQTDLARKNLSLLVWDCYRPTRAVRDFINWRRSQRPALMKDEFFPRTDKNKLFALGYLSSHSAHSRGSTVDVGLVPSAVHRAPSFDVAMPLVPCTAPKGVRFDDGTIDFGTGYDCLDPLASTDNPGVSREARLNRFLLQRVMQQHGFISNSREWWHFRFVNDSPTAQSFDFPIVARRRRNGPPGQAPCTLPTRFLDESPTAVARRYSVTPGRRPSGEASKTEPILGSNHAPPVAPSTWGGLVPRRIGRDRCPVGSQRQKAFRAPVRGPAADHGGLVSGGANDRSEIVCRRRLGIE